MHHNQSSRLDIKTAANKQQQKKHKYRELLTHLQCCTKSPLSYKEQAEIVGCSKFFAKKVAKQNLLNSVITITNTKHEPFGRNLAGKNIYSRGPSFNPSIHLIDGIELKIERSVEKGRLKIFFTDQPLRKSKKFTTNKNYKSNLDKSKFAKTSGMPLAGHFCSSYEEFLKKSGRKALFAKYGFEKQVSKAPNWWFKDIVRLKTALRLLKSKLKRGFKPKNFYKFISYLLKRGIFSWHRHCARKTSVAIARPTLKRIEPYMESDSLATGYEALKKLYQTYRLNISFSNVQKLARHGYSKLFTAAEVMLKRLKMPGIKDVNAFMHHLISMKEPYDILRKKHV